MRKRRPPSQIRYEKSHPTISFRLNRELKTRLEETLEKESFASFVKEALGKREREKKTLEEAHASGYEEGYEEAKDKYSIQAPCTICGETMFIHSDEAKEKLAQVIKSEVWYHTGCEESERRSKK